MCLRFEEVSTPMAQLFRENTRRFYSGGTVRVSPSECALPARYREFAARVKAMEVREDDVWIVTYPKCGTTWTQEMVWLIMHDLDYEGAKTILSERFPFLEFGCVASPEEEVELGLPTSDNITYTESLPSPRCIKSHLPKELLPDQLWTKKPKIIYVTRRVKDVVASYFSHHRLCNGYTGTLEDFAEAFMAENIVYWDPFWKHILEFWKMRKEPNILINTFEEMKKDLPSVIRKTAKFLGKSFSEEQVSLLAKHLDFSNMRVNPSVNAEEESEILKERFATDGNFIRKGVVGSGEKELSPTMVARMDIWSQERIRDSGYPWVG